MICFLQKKQKRVFYKASRYNLVTPPVTARKTGKKERGTKVSPDSSFFILNSSFTSSSQPRYYLDTAPRLWRNRLVRPFRLASRGVPVRNRRRCCSHAHSGWPRRTSHTNRVPSACVPRRLPFPAMRLWLPRSCPVSAMPLRGSKPSRKDRAAIWHQPPFGRTLSLSQIGSILRKRHLSGNKPSLRCHPGRMEPLRGWPDIGSRGRIPG